MDDCSARKAFDSLWSITDEIFKYVADIRTIVNDDKDPEGEVLPSDPPSYENSMSEQIIGRLNQKLTCLENLNKKRKALLGEFSTALKSDDLDEKKQISEKVSPGESALKSWLSYTRTRHGALKASLDLLQQANQGLPTLHTYLTEENAKGEDHDRGCDWRVEGVFYDTMNKYACVYSKLCEDRVALLREGKMFEETILKLPHETNEETNKILKNVKDSYLLVKNANLSRSTEDMRPILSDYLKTQRKLLIKDAVNRVIINMQNSFNEYTRRVQAYNEALQSLADHLIT